jgi:chromate reductase
MKIVGFAGSLREKSYTKMALRVVIKNFEEAGVEAEFIDLKPLNIPPYDGDVEQEIQLPDGIKQLREKIERADGLILALSEYNHSISGVMKNTIDWLSRTKFYPSIFDNKKVGIFSVSDGIIGGARAQIAFYPTAVTLNMDLMPSKVYVPNVDQKFDEAGNLNDEKTKESLKKFAQKFVDFLQV